MEKTKVVQNEDSRFMIVHHDPNTDEEKFFGGFSNEVECPGTEEESFSYENEEWVDRPEDGAMMFKTSAEAGDFFLEIERPGNECSIVLYGKHDVENSMLGSRWYPLKVFNA